MANTRWEPFRDLVALQDRMNRLFEQSMRSRSDQEEYGAGGWTPATDIYESDAALIIAAELPGVAKDAIEISLDSGILSLQGERSTPGDVPADRYHRQERQYGRFNRSFALPTDVDGNKVTAEYENGVLRIEIPKQPRKGDTRQITIR